MRKVRSQTVEEKKTSVGRLMRVGKRVRVVFTHAKGAADQVTALSGGRAALRCAVNGLCCATQVVRAARE